MPDETSPLFTSKPIPMGFQNNNQNYSLYSTSLVSPSINLYEPGNPKPFHSIPLEKSSNDLYIATPDPLPADTEYMLYSPSSGEFLDPYAKALTTPKTWGDWKHVPRCQLTTDHKFDWEGISPPQHSKDSLVIYEMHTRGFTQSPTSNINHPGTFLGIIEKIPYLKSLGITSIELMPIFEFDERENSFISPDMDTSLFNYWGYSTLNFFSPMKRYATSTDRLSPLIEFQTLVKELHRNNIEVILDVVYNHTTSNSSLEIIDKPSYFILDENGEHQNFSGCGNTISANSPPATNLILSSLRYWAEECHVDGFRFDLGGALVRSHDGTPLEAPPLFKCIENDPILSHCKMLGEPWDCGGINLNGNFPLKDFSDWNGEFRHSVRKYLRGDPDSCEAFHKSLLGKIADSDGTNNNVNYVDCHDGFSLNDLVSYTEKHNFANGEDNNDGDSDNHSTNQGIEGPTDDETILVLREKLMKKFILATIFAKGIPMIVMGDECGLSHLGNNNPYCQDNELSWFNWENIKTNQELLKFFQRAVHLRNSDSDLTKPDRNIRSYIPEVDNHLRSGIFIEDEYFIGFNRADSEWNIGGEVDENWKVILAVDKEQYDQPSVILPNGAFIAYRQNL